MQTGPLRGHGSATGAGYHSARWPIRLRGRRDDGPALAHALLSGVGPYVRAEGGGDRRSGGWDPGVAKRLQHGPGPGGARAAAVSALAGGPAGGPLVRPLGLFCRLVDGGACCRAGGGPKPRKSAKTGDGGIGRAAVDASISPRWTRISQSLTLKTNSDPLVQLAAEQGRMLREIGILMERGALEPFRRLEFDIQVDKWDIRMLAMAWSDNPAASEP